MLKYKKGDLIKAAKACEVNVIAHQCNCFNNMGAGIAPQIKKAFPKAWLADKETIKGSKEKLGSLSYAEDAGVVVFNLYGQYSYGRGVNTSYEMLRKAIQQMVRMLPKDRESVKIGLPKIGCGLGGGNWKIVSKILEEELYEFDVTIYEL